MNNLPRRKTFCLPAPPAARLLEVKPRHTPSPPVSKRIVADEDETELRIPLTNNLPVSVFTQWFTYAYWERVKLNEVLEEALKLYLKDKPMAQKRLKPKEQAILDGKIQKEQARHKRG